MRVLEIARFPRSLTASLMLRRTAATVLFALAGAALAPAQSPTGGLYGKIDGEYYVAPGAAYRYPIPVMPKLGGRVEDTEGVVTFDDPLGLHLSIASFPLDLSQKWEWETRGAKDYLGYFHANFILPDFQRRYPGSADEASVFVPELYGGTLIVFTLLPGGSFFTEQSSVLGTPVTPGPIVAKRGTLLFVREARIFIMSLELAERVTQRSTFKKTPEEENALLRDRILTYARRFEFPQRKPATPPAPRVP